MKKRTFIAFIITILTLIFANRLWYNYKPISVDFDIESKGRYSIEAQLNKKDNNEFTKIRAAKGDFDLNKVNHIHFDVKKSKKPKRLRIVISSLDNLNTIKIKNIKLNNKLKLTDLKKTAIGGG